MAEHCVEPIPACWRPLLKELQRESDAVQPRREAAYAVLRAAGVVGLLGDTDTHRIVRVPAHADLRQCRNCGRPFYALSDEPRARRRWGYCQRGCTWHERRWLAHRRGEPPIVRPPLRPWPKRTCLHCGDEFVPARRDARYCSGTLPRGAAPRQQAHGQPAMIEVTCMPNNRVTEHEVERMAVAATLGEELVPVTPAARERWEAIKRDVAAIKARGQMLDIPFDLP